jgi:hypothetical protein
VNKPFRIEPEAIDELDEASQWYEDRREGLGREFLVAIDDSFDLINRWPAASSALPVPDRLS